MASSSSGIGFIGILQIVFIVLKLLGKIDRSWKWVLAPTWISAIIVGLILLLMLAVEVITTIQDAPGKRRRSYKRKAK